MTASCFLFRWYYRREDNIWRVSVCSLVFCDFVNMLLISVYSLILSCRSVPNPLPSQKISSNAPPPPTIKTRSHTLLSDALHQRLLLLRIPPTLAPRTLQPLPLPNHRGHGEERRHRAQDNPHKLRHRQPPGGPLLIPPRTASRVRSTTRRHRLRTVRLLCIVTAPAHPRRRRLHDIKLPRALHTHLGDGRVDREKHPDLGRPRDGGEGAAGGVGKGEAFSGLGEGGPGDAVIGGGQGFEVAGGVDEVEAAGGAGGDVDCGEGGEGG